MCELILTLLHTWHFSALEMAPIVLGTYYLILLQKPIQIYQSIATWNCLGSVHRMYYPPMLATDISGWKKYHVNNMCWLMSGEYSCGDSKMGWAGYWLEGVDKGVQLCLVAREKWYQEAIFVLGKTIDPCYVLLLLAFQHFKSPCILPRCLCGVVHHHRACCYFKTSYC